MPATLETIARELKVSKVSVSLALRGSSRVSESLRTEVHRVAKKVGYVPNPMVSALMASLRRQNPGNQSCNLGMLTAFETRDGWKEIPVFSRYLQGAKNRAKTLGYGIELHWTGDAAGSNNRLTQILYTRGIPGLILMPLPERGMSIEIDWSRFAMVAIGSTFTKVNCDRVGNNQFHSINTALENCRKLGYRKIGLALPKLVDDKVDHIWLAGYLAFKHLHKELSAVEPLIADRFNVNTFREWYLRNKPDVVVTTHIPILEWLSKLGFRVPDDVGYVHLDWIPERGDFAGINQNPEAVGAAAVDLLVEQVNQNRRGIPPVARSLHVEGIWRNGPTAPGLKS